MNENKAGKRRGTGCFHPLSKPFVTIGVGAAGLASIGAYWLLRDVGAAASWGVAIGVLVAGADPRWFLSAAIAFFLLPPLFLALDVHSVAEWMAALAFHTLALGIGLEFRNDMVQRVHQRRSIHSLVDED